MFYYQRLASSHAQEIEKHIEVFYPNNWSYFLDFSIVLYVYHSHKWLGTDNMVAIEP